MAVLLCDDQVRRYVADGFVVLDSDMGADFHAGIADELDYAVRHEAPHPGDNLLPRVPAAQELLESPVVRGAMESLLGPEFAWAPHRFPHNSEPLPEADGAFDPFGNAPRMGEGSRSGSAWHQDGHSRAGRSRWHTFRAANLFYFPHDTPLEMGPTRLLAGSHLYANLHGIVPEQVFMRPISAGTVVIADFDVGHAGTPNATGQSRYMLKFVALRQQNPRSPSWNHEDSRWRTPEHLLTPHHLPDAWTSLWNWLRGSARDEGVAVQEKPSDLAARLKSPDQGGRLEALYGLAAAGEQAIPTLVGLLLAAAGRDRHMSPPATDPAFHGAPRDFLDRRFTHRQFTPEDSAVALGAIGEPALAALGGLLHHDDPWVRLNAAYAIGDADREAASADQVGELLDDPLESVVRVAIDALCALGDFGAPTVARLHRLMTEATSGWDVPAMGRHWTIQDQVRYAVAWALTARASGAAPPRSLEAAFVAALADRTGYVPATACIGLERLGTASALKAAVRYLSPRRWDTVHHRFARAARARA